MVWRAQHSLKVLLSVRYMRIVWPAMDSIDQFERKGYPQCISWPISTHQPRLLIKEFQTVREKNLPGEHPAADSIQGPQHQSQVPEYTYTGLVSRVHYMASSAKKIQKSHNFNSKA